ncbi:MAG: DUF2970 domain-containing protein [SAR86 cluster bacterium]|uniref:DUF2970 domain-containing protein n=1 Tax=SAR86 cluster bacterium TaxID=2030880 RepID=A0A520MZU5_9GAMM|nr:MAG: DUF2970 domain-containing protein [Gammaproteobacteria bacterium TMED225]RZO26735.1 MAG: DUF2970 domain-containing protein [SAR86 cluster bacterium]
MWFYRIINSFLGIRKETELSKDLKNITFKKIVILFISINLIFVTIVLLITKIFINDL